jgi:hypothetical protein
VKPLSSPEEEPVCWEVFLMGLFCGAIFMFPCRRCFVFPIDAAICRVSALLVSSSMSPTDSVSSWSKLDTPMQCGTAG